MTTEKLRQRVDELITMGNAVLKTRNERDYVDSGMTKGFRVASLSFIGRVCGERDVHYTEFLRTTGGYLAYEVDTALGILKAIRDEIEGGWLFTMRGLVTAEVFTDYMEMAEHLLEADYKDPAAVIAGSTLEEHLRQLCMKNGIPVTQKKDGKDVPLKADLLNSELTKAGLYNTVEQKLVTGWLGIRNSAAHGKYEEYNADHVKGMITGVLEFMARNAL